LDVTLSAEPLQTGSGLDTADMTAVLDGLRRQWRLSGGGISMAQEMGAHMHGAIKRLSAS